MAPSNGGITQDERYSHSGSQRDESRQPTATNTNMLSLDSPPEALRNPSPTRTLTPTIPPVNLQSARARNSALSPTRTSSASAGAATPSAAAVQRALSTANSSFLKNQPLGEGLSKLQRAQSESSQPTSPSLAPSRVKSPPPSTSSSRRSSLGSSERQVELGERSPSVHSGQKQPDGIERTLSPTHAQPRGPRGPSGFGSRLETVEEGDHSISPQNRNILSEEIREGTPKQSVSGDNANAPTLAFAPQTAKPSRQAEQKPQPNDKGNLPPPQAPSRKASNTSLAPTKTRAHAEGSKHMTVETETVQSIPQAALNAASERAGSARVQTGGSLRARPSSDTIRPKKDKKKAAKKPPPILSGPGSSKAEMFEAKVASEIDGESSDSDETFVYESNPAEVQSRSRHHSRTPSTTSLANTAERQRITHGGRVLTGGESNMDRPMRAKRSMKFASNSYAGSSFDDEPVDVVQRNSRVPTFRSTPRQYGQRKHVDGVARHSGQGSDSPLDSDSPFSQAQRMRTSTAMGLGSRSPRGNYSPRHDSPPGMQTPTKKAFENGTFDAAASGTSDDERAPLLRSLRNPRTRGAHHLRHADFYDPPAPRSSCSGSVTGCVLFALALLLLVGLGGGFVFATNKPLFGVSVMEIQNVLASEQEIMLDLLVQATNPNIAQITISDMDVNVFAKSSHVADPAPESIEYGKERKQLLSIQSRDGVDEGTDPICPPSEPDCDLPGDHDQQTMLLGRVFHFDSSLSFEPSPFRRLPSNSSGELRLARPGNRTESGGSQRWERVIKHPFELIVRGILKYQLPLSTRVQTRSIGASVLVHPEEGVDGRGVMKVIQLGRLPSLEEVEYRVPKHGEARILGTGHLDNG